MKTLQRVAFKMHLFPGKEAEYRKRHDELWPELAKLLKQTGVNDYSIFLDEKTGALFGILSMANPAALDSLPEHPVMKKWWAYMSDLMETNADQSPVTIPLKEVFYLP